jgi:CubicO group peptidase (beta-lactamase class C family)
VIDDGLAASGAHGVLRLGETGAVTPGAVFRLGSITKVITSLAVLQLRDEGRLSLDEPAEGLLAELAGLVYPTADAARDVLRA